MAVSRIEKLTLLADIQYKSSILKSVQSMQSVEIIDWKEKDVNQEVLTKYFHQQNHQADELLIKEIEHDGKCEEKLKKIQDAIAFIEQNSLASKSGHLGMPQRKDYDLFELEAQVKEKGLEEKLEYLNQLSLEFGRVQKQKKNFLSIEEDLTHWRKLDINLGESGNLSYVKNIAGTIDLGNVQSLDEQLAGLTLIYREEIYQSQTQRYEYFLCLKEDFPHLKSILDQAGFTEYHPQYKLCPKEEYSKREEKHKNLQEEEKKLLTQIANAREDLTFLRLAEEDYLAAFNRQKIDRLICHVNQFFLLQGWVVAEHKEELLNYLVQKVPKEDIYLEWEKPIDKEYAKVPIHLKNSGWVKPFEMLTEMYSLPRYDEIDPTPWMTPFYLVFFGMMVADVGYGILLLLGTLLAQKFFSLNPGAKRFADFFSLVSIPTIIWGLIYGSFFGVELPFRLLSMSADVNQILILSVLFGLIQILVGLAINAIEQIKKKRYLESISHGFAWQGILLGAVIAILAKILWKNEVVFLIAVAVAIISAILIVIIPMIQSKSKMKGLAKGMYQLYGISSYVGDLVSYTRLMALGISGGSIASAFNLLVGFMPPVIRFSLGILLIIVLHGINLFLSLLSAYVHGARLQYVEFFGKFYQGGGRAFRPFKAEEKYVNVRKI
ncbi:V-type ATP synthase subunit I [Clostridia bacterium]|nr:V-type ATP synthase subunit I [Clostridia bacterium]